LGWGAGGAGWWGGGGGVTQKPRNMHRTSGGTKRRLREQRASGWPPAAGRPYRTRAGHIPLQHRARFARLVIMRTMRVIPDSAAFCSKLPSVRPPTVTADGGGGRPKNQRGIHAHGRSTVRENVGALALRLTCGMEYGFSVRTIAVEVTRLKLHLG
jgi:hypothetical protein